MLYEVQQIKIIQKFDPRSATFLESKTLWSHLKLKNFSDSGVADFIINMTKLLQFEWSRGV